MHTHIARRLTVWHQLESLLERLKLEVDDAAGAKEDAAAEMKKRGEEPELGEREGAGLDVGVSVGRRMSNFKYNSPLKKRGGLLPLGFGLGYSIRLGCRLALEVSVRS